jgi:hypothetical protein
MTIEVAAVSIGIFLIVWGAFMAARPDRRSKPNLAAWPLPPLRADLEACRNGTPTQTQSVPFQA